MFSIKETLFYVLMIIGFFNCYADQKIPTVVLETVFVNPQSSDNNLRSGIWTRRDTIPTYYSNHSYSNYASLSSAEFQQCFQHVADVSEILNLYPLYAFPEFLSFARTLPGYDGYILTLHDKIKHDKAFRKQTACMPYFEYSFGLRREKSGFHDFVNAEVQRIINQELNFLLHSCIQKINGMQQDITYERLHDRLVAIDQTSKHNGKCFNYASQTSCLKDDCNDKAFQNTYGTHLDCQLHKELCQTRNTMRYLERTYSHDSHVQILAPVVYHYTTQAKNEKCPVIAFELADFCHTIIQVLLNGMDVLYDASFAVGKGAWKGVNEFASIERWKDLAMGTVQLGLLFVNELGQEDALRYAMMLEATSQNSGVFTKAVKQHYEYTQAQRDVINRCVQETYKKIKEMSWQEILEHGSEIGTTMILDTLALNAVNGFCRAASNVVVKQLNGAIGSGALFTEQYAIEVAGFGKLIVEEGVEISAKASDIIKNDLVFLKNENKCIAQSLCKWKASNFAPGKLETHFNKHVIKKAEWGNIPISMDDYLNRARALLNGRINDSIEGFVSKEGWVFRYDKAANELAIAKPDGIIETLFRPVEGMNYWIEQIKKYK